MDKQNLFVEKNSDFGELLTTAINEEEIPIEDEKDMIRRYKILNTLINEYSKEIPNKTILSIISSLIKENDYDKLYNELTDKYDEEILKTIAYTGMKPQNYLKSLEPELTGFEQNGYLYKENNWYQFNIETKKSLKIEKTENKIKKRKIN